MIELLGGGPPPPLHFTHHLKMVGLLVLLHWLNANILLLALQNGVESFALGG